MDTIQHLIKYYIESNGYTIYSISQQSGINRTTLQKILSGQRKITRDVYEKLLPFFSLSPIDKEELDRAFLADQIGLERFQTHMEIKKLLESSPSSISPNTEQPSDAVTVNIDKLADQTLVHGTYEIANIIYTLAVHAVECEAQPFLYTYADLSHPYVPFFFKPLYHPRFQPLTVTHLVEYQKTLTVNGNYDNIHNLRILMHLLPSFRSFPGSFSVYFYYAARHDFKSLASVFPYYVITNTHVVLFSSDYETALVISNPDLHEHYLNVYRNALTKSSILTSGAQSPMELLSELNKVDPNEHYPLCLNIQPTIEKYITPAMVEKYMLDTPYRELIKAKLFVRIDQLTMENHTVLFTEEGLRLFTEKGKNVNFPDELASHFDIEDRIYILNKFIEANMHENDNHFLMVDPSKLHTSLNISIAFAPPSSTYIMLVQSNGNSMIIPLREHTLCSCIMDFIQTLPQYGYVCSLEETNRILQEEVKKLEQQL